MSATLRATLERDPEFNRLWAGQTVSVFGSMVTRAALPFTTSKHGASQTSRLSRVSR